MKKKSEIKDVSTSEKQPYHRNYNFLYGFILILILFVVVLSITLYLNYNLRDSIVDKQPPEKTETVKLPSPISKPADILSTEKNLQMFREVNRLDDGSIKITARLENIDTLKSNLVLNDFIETIRFGKNIKITDSKLNALNGNLFPPGDKVNISHYGPGPVDSKATRFDIALLDLDFTSNSTDTYLYELIFTPEENITEISFDGAEIRSGKFIIKLAEEKISL